MYVLKVCTGAEVEMITEGGEVGFVTRIIEESAVLKEGCRYAFCEQFGFCVGRFAVTLLS